MHSPPALMYALASHRPSAPPRMLRQKSNPSPRSARHPYLPPGPLHRAEYGSALGTWLSSRAVHHPWQGRLISALRTARSSWRARRHGCRGERHTRPCCCCAAGPARCARTLTPTSQCAGGGGCQSASEPGRRVYAPEAAVTVAAAAVSFPTCRRARPADQSVTTAAASTLPDTTARPPPSFADRLPIPPARLHCSHPWTHRRRPDDGMPTPTGHWCTRERSPRDASEIPVPGPTCSSRGVVLVRSFKRLVTSSPFPRYATEYA